MDSGHGELSQDADSANSAPGKRAARAFHVQPPTLGTDRLPKKLTRKNSLSPRKETGPPPGPDGAAQTCFHFHGHEEGGYTAGLEHFIISAVAWFKPQKPHSVVAQVHF